MELSDCLVWKFPHGAYPRFDYFNRNVSEYGRRHDNLLKKGWLEINIRRKIKEQLALLNGPVTVVFVAASSAFIPLPKIVQHRDLPREDELPKCNYVNLWKLPDVLKESGPLVVVYQFRNKIDAKDRLILMELQVHLPADSYQHLIFVDMARTSKYAANQKSELSPKRRRKRHRRRGRNRRQTFQRPTTGKLREPGADFDASPSKARRLHERNIVETKNVDIAGDQSALGYDIAQLGAIFEGHDLTNFVITDEENVSDEICKKLEVMSVEVLLLIDKSLRQIRDASYTVPEEDCFADVLKDHMEKLTQQSFANKTNLQGWSKELEQNSDWRKNVKLKTFHEKNVHYKDFSECYFCGLLYNLQLATTRMLHSILQHATVVKTSVVPMLNFEMAKIDPFEKLKDGVWRKFEEKIGSTNPYPRYYVRVRRQKWVHQKGTDAMRKDLTLQPEPLSKQTQSIHLMESILRKHGQWLASETAQTAREVFVQVAKDSRTQWVKKLSRLHWEVSGLLAQTKSQSPESGTKTEKERLQVQDRVMNELLRSDESILGFGYFFGNFRVHVHKSLYQQRSHVVNNKIATILTSYGINDYEVIPVSKDIDKFVKPTKNFGVGDTITDSKEREEVQTPKSGPNVEKKNVKRKGRSGTLGGLAECTLATGNPVRMKTVCALVSDHVVRGATEVFVRDSGGGQYLEIGVPIVGGDKEGLLDISAVRLNDNVARRFHKLFMNSSGKYQRAKLFDFNDDASLEQLKGRPVHIWGATSRPGRGVIASPAFVEKNGSSANDGACGGPNDDEDVRPVAETSSQEEVERSKNASKESQDTTEGTEAAESQVPHHKLVIIADKEVDESEEDDETESTAESAGMPFSREGDSGSIIVADDPDDKNLLVLSMLIGKRTGRDHEYYTFRLPDGLQSLQNRTGNTFTLYEKD